MAVPKKRHSRSRRDKRRSHQALVPPKLVPCPHCSEPRLPHHVCPHCGFYKKEGVIQVD